jgi:threonine dehydratase
VRFAREEHLIVEGSAAVSLAALQSPRLIGQRIAAVISGRNISLELFTRIVASRS